jgi:itaconate CoA-transferase
VSFHEEYQKKLMSAEQAVGLLENGDHIVKAMAVCEPPALLDALAARVESNDLRDITIYYYHSLEYAARSILRYELLDRIKLKCGFYHTVERQLAKRGREEGRKLFEFLPNSFGEFPRMLRSEKLHVDATILTVSPMDKAGFFSFGVNHDYGPAACRTSKKVLVEVNENMPRINGRTLLHVSEVDAIVENHLPLLEVTSEKELPEAEAIARNIVELIPDGATLQMGVGCIPDRVCQYLEGHKDLGIHSECLTPGLVKLAKMGIANGFRKTLHNRKAIFSFTWGDKAHYEFLDDNLYFEAHPTDYVIDPMVIEKNDNFISINSLLEIDLLGQVNSEALGHRQFSATGGQLDFVRGSQRSKGGKSILAFTATAGGGRFSRIVPTLNGPVTDTRLDVQYVITEHGIANLKGMTSTERAHTLISLAEPKFREELEKAAHDMYLF